MHSVEISPHVSGSAALVNVGHLFVADIDQDEEPRDIVVPAPCLIRIFIFGIRFLDQSLDVLEEIEQV
jgi:hypothetical protein